MSKKDGKKEPQRIAGRILLTFAVDPPGICLSKGRAAIGKIGERYFQFHVQTHGRYSLIRALDTEGRLDFSGLAMHLEQFCLTLSDLMHDEANARATLHFFRKHCRIIVRSTRMPYFANRHLAALARLLKRRGRQGEGEEGARLGELVGLIRSTMRSLRATKKAAQKQEVDGDAAWFRREADRIAAQLKALAGSVQDDRAGKLKAPMAEPETMGDGREKKEGQKKGKSARRKRV